jgi:hypothetical protein
VIVPASLDEDLFFEPPEFWRDCFGELLPVDFVLLTGFTGLLVCVPMPLLSAMTLLRSLRATSINDLGACPDRRCGGHLLQV